MERVTGIGGVFFKCQDPKALSAWYAEHLGVNIGWPHGAVFSWPEGQTPERPGGTTLGFFSADSEYMDPGKAPFMVNFRVPNLAAMLDQLRAGGCEVVDKTEVSEFGSFGWVIDPEGNKVELWEPPEGA